MVSTFVSALVDRVIRSRSSVISGKINMQVDPEFIDRWWPIDEVMYLLESGDEVICLPLSRKNLRKRLEEALPDIPRHRLEESAMVMLALRGHVLAEIIPKMARYDGFARRLLLET